MANVLIPGGGGYVGTVLAPQLVAAGHRVRVYDTFYFGQELKPSPDLEIITADIRDRARFAAACQGMNVVIQLACISNDPSFELNESLSKSINFDCFEPMVLEAKAAGVQRFIYASSSSVYGVSDAPEVTEDHPLLPLTLYNKFKGMCEPILFRHQSPDFICTTIRPATVCGYSPRMRFDLTVNILTNHAVNQDRITVFGGSQKRPNLHILDMCDLYELLLGLPDAAIAGETFNAGYQNQTVMDIARIVKNEVEAEYPEKTNVPIVVTPTEDNRSYHINSDKITRHIGFRPKRTIEDAVHDVCRALKADLLPNSMTDSRYYNVRTLKEREAA